MPPEGLSTLGLPLKERGCVYGATLALFVYYAATLARDLSLYDSGELALAAVQLGLGHPPGQPLHTLTGFLLSHLPLIPPLVGVALASAIPAALTLVPATSLAQALAGPSCSRAMLRSIPWLLAIIGLHESLWEQASRVEVYALASFFAVWAVARIAEPSVGHVLQAGLALGLCASVNPMIALCTGLAVAPGLLTALVRRQLPTKALGLAIAGGLLGLVPYAYVLLIARRNDVMIWGAPSDAASLWHYLSLRDYVHNQQITAGLWIGHALAWLRFSALRLLMPLLLLGLAGHALHGRRTLLGRAAYPILLCLLVASISSYVVWSLDIPDFNGYLATPLWLAAAGCGGLCAVVFDSGRKLVAGTLAASLVVSALVATPAVFARTRQHDHLARALAERVLHEAPAHAIVIAEADHFAGSLFYLQEAEHQRPDVIVLAYGLASSAWHWQHLQRMHPELTQIALHGPGGRAGRVQRWLASNASRAILVERLGLAAELGLRACGGGLYLRTGQVCDDGKPASLAPAQLLADTLAKLSLGSPSAGDAIADVSYNSGESLWRLGQPRAAFITFLSGVPKAMQPAITVPAAVDRAPALTIPPPRWQRGTALGDPARNLFLAGGILAAAGETAAATEYLNAAAADGLPEATALVQSAR